MIRYRAVDLETTDKPENGGQPCEAGWFDVMMHSNGNKTFPCHEARLVNPGCQMSYEAQAVHHITQDMLEDAPRLAHVMPEIEKGVDVFVAHQIDFEQSFIQTEKPWICTLRIARRVFDTLHRHDLQFLKYRLDLPVNAEQALPAHRAGPDAYLCGMLFAHLAKLVPIARMIEWSQYHALVPVCHYNKHRGTPWKEVVSMDRDYAQFIIQGDFPEDIKFTVAHWLRNT